MHKKNIIIFGGSGFVGRHLIEYFANQNKNVHIINADLLAPQAPLNQGQWINTDARHTIEGKNFPEIADCIINLAAIHKTPGHPSNEYFETNINGAKNICAFAEANKINKVIFTSSISVYGPDEEEKTENSLTRPNIPYGISKIIAEHIHREWYLAAPNRHLSIVRPAVIFGKGEKGNFTRIAKALRKKVFVYPGRRDTIKSCCYVKDICRLIMREIEQGQGYSLYNFCYPEKFTLEDVCNAFHKALGYNLPILSVPQELVNTGVSFLRKIDMPFIRSLGLHPERVAKLVNSTNISSQRLIDSGFTFKYNLIDAIKDWSADCGGPVLY